MLCPCRNLGVVWEIWQPLEGRWLLTRPCSLVSSPFFCLQGLGGEEKVTSWQCSCALVEEFLRGCDVRRMARFGRLLSGYTRLERKYIAGFQFTVIS